MLRLARLDTPGALHHVMGRGIAAEGAMEIYAWVWNLALLPEKEREKSLVAARPSFDMDEAQFEDFRQSVILPMIRRHYEMFPKMQRQEAVSHPKATAAPWAPITATQRVQKYPGTGRNAPCPCNSGKKYKRCCGR